MSRAVNSQAVDGDRASISAERLERSVRDSWGREETYQFCSEAWLKGEEKEEMEEEEEVEAVRLSRSCPHGLVQR